jgi:hypothetical protein
MKSSKLIGNLVLLSLLLSLVTPSYSFGAVKAGSVCKKLNSTTTVSGYKYTCIKSGKKLVWSKGLKVKAVNPALDSKPTQNPVVSWSTVRSSKVAELRNLLNTFWVADSYKDATLFLTSCGKLSNFIGTLPIDTPLVADLRLASTYCAGRSVPERIAAWLNNYVVQGFAECVIPKFKATFVKTYVVRDYQVIEFDYTNDFPEVVSLWRLSTNYPHQAYEDLYGVFDINASNFSSVNLRFNPNETRRIGFVMESWRYRSFIAEGRGEPKVYSSVTELLDPKYGGGGRCMMFKALPSGQ